MTAVHAAGARHVGRQDVWEDTRLAIRRDRWLALIWVTLLVAAVYVSAKATPWLYPTSVEQVRAAESIDASTAIVALYGPILDTHSLGELAMTKLTVLYSVFVALMCIVVVRRNVRAAPRSAMVEAAVLATLVGVLAALAAIAAGLPVLGSLMFGASWTGIGLVATMLTAAIYQLPFTFRTRGWMTAAAISVLYALRVVGDTSSSVWLSWLSPFGWSTRLEAWSSPRAEILILYVVAAAGLCVVALRLHATHDVALDVAAAPSAHRDRTALGIWTVASGALAALYGVISPEVSVLLESATAREIIERLGGSGSVRDALTAAEFSIVAAVVTGFGILVVQHAAEDDQSGRTHARLGRGKTKMRAFLAVVALALIGPTWLLLITGTMFTAGDLATGGSMTTRYIVASLNHAPAVWTVVGLAVVAWCFRPASQTVGWWLLALFVSIGQLGQLVGAPRWLIDLSPYARIAPIAAEKFDLTSTVALTAGVCVLLAIAAYNYARRELPGPGSVPARTEVALLDSDLGT